jgi:hypothetical protein
MLKDLMHSAGMREKLRADEVKRVREEALEEARKSQGEALETAVAEGRINQEAARAALEAMGMG